MDFAGKTVLVLGTGGTHATVSAVCRDGGAKEILTASRTGRNGALTYAQAAARSDVQVVINTTPCGMYPQTGQCLLDVAALPQLEAVLDVVYNPFATELVLRAKDRGLVAVGGFEMLVAQAVYAAEHFIGKPLDSETLIPQISRELQKELQNVVLIGMPGCGKSTVGAVIACGGGVVKTPENRHALRQNGPVLWVQRPLDKLATAGRPLSKGGAALREMEQERLPLYRAASTAALCNDGALADTVAAALHLLK